jgi:16S rRNA (uracil1498-N3)-methyltransferase
MKRYYASALDRGVLDAEQAHHCSDVMRQKVGDLLSVFNGEGVEAKARITAIDGDAVKFEVLAKATAPRALHPIWLAQALTKKNAMELILQKATELGVAAIVPLQSDHSVVQVDDEKSDAKLDKWRKLTIEAAKQCGQNWLPKVHAPQKPGEFIAGIPKGAVKLIASLQPEAGHAHHRHGRTGGRLHPGRNRRGPVSRVRARVAREDHSAGGNGGVFRAQRAGLRVDGLSAVAPVH